MVTKFSGTATIGTVQIDATTVRADGSGSNRTGLWSIPVTGTGSLTLRLQQTSGTNAYISLIAAEVTDSDVSVSRRTPVTLTGTTGTSVVTGNITTGGAGIIVGAVSPGNPYGTITITPETAFSTIAELEDDSNQNCSMMSPRRDHGHHRFPGMDARHQQPAQQRRRGLQVVYAMKKLLALLALCALVGSASAATVFSTTFNCASDWTGSMGLSDATVCANGDFILGYLNASAPSHPNGDEINATANNAAGGGGKGFRHWDGGNVRNSGGGSIHILGFTPQREMWIRYYARYQSGYDWSNGPFMKMLYVNSSAWSAPRARFISATTMVTSVGMSKWTPRTGHGAKALPAWELAICFRPSHGRKRRAATWAMGSSIATKSTSR